MRSIINCIESVMNDEYNLSHHVCIKFYKSHVESNLNLRANSSRSQPWAPPVCSKWMSEWMIEGSSKLLNKATAWLTGEQILPYAMIWNLSQVWLWYVAASRWIIPGREKKFKAFSLCYGEREQSVLHRNSPPEVVSRRHLIPGLTLNP